MAEQDHPETTPVADTAHATDTAPANTAATPDNQSHQASHEPKNQSHGHGHGHGHGGHPIIIKKIKKHKHGHHGGAWKIAYADFVTAMMAFFLMMWLISMLNKYQLQGVSNYFKTPLKEPLKNQVSEQMKNQGIDKPPAPIADKIVKVAPLPKPPIDAKELSLAQMKAMKTELENKLKNDKSMDDVKNNIDFAVSGDGLKIHIHDLEGKPMFSIGQTDFAAYATKIVGWLSKQIVNQNNRIMIIGHTDANPYHGRFDYTNWELSTDRANAVRRELVKAGIPENRFLRVAGSADQDKLNQKDSLDAANRRIEIILLTKESSNKILDED